MDFLSFLALLGIAYLLWRIADQLPDLIFRISEIQRDTAELLRAAQSEAKPADAQKQDAAASNAKD